VNPGLYQLSYRHRGRDRIARADSNHLRALDAQRPRAEGRFIRP
jgi:hypothetical protein